jgi:galactokinase
MSPTHEERRARFQGIYHRLPHIAVRAPGRINLIGEHVDYEEGLVMPAAIDRYIFADAAVIDEPEIRLWSATCGRPPLRLPLADLAPLHGTDAWANYVTGVVAKYRDAGAPVRGFDVTFDASLPLGAGMSSSAALEMATALIVEATTGMTKSPRERALLCQAAEHEYAGVPCGIMDQLAVSSGVRGHALLIDCRTLEVRPNPLPEGIAIVVVDSRVKHALADGEYAKRKADCETASRVLGVHRLRDATMESVNAAREQLGDRVFRRARHVVSEVGRVLHFAAALEGGDVATVGLLMASSHLSLRDDYEVSCTELDALVEIADHLGVIGARMMGGGFGGSTVNLVREEEATAVAEAICARYREANDAEVEAFVVHAVDGAALEA